jgi:hypothetical protein
MSTTENRQQKFRKQNPRIDYSPTPAALAVIHKLQAQLPDWNRRQVMDLLIELGGEAHENKSDDALKGRTQPQA